MAHTCPDCGSYCTCCGDIDDMDLGIFFPACICCIDRYDDPDEDDWYNDDDNDDDNPNDSRNL